MSSKKNKHAANKDVAELHRRLLELEAKNVSLEKKVCKLEEKQVVIERVNTLLSNEVDRLHQYTRRSNNIIRNVLQPSSENESVQEVEEKTKK